MNFLGKFLCKVIYNLSVDKIKIKSSLPNENIDRAFFTCLFNY